MKLQTAAAKSMVRKKVGNVWVYSQSLRKIPEVQQMFSVRRPRELHLLLLFFNYKFIYETIFPLLKLTRWTAGQSAGLMCNPEYVHVNMKTPQEAEISVNHPKCFSE